LLEQYVLKCIGKLPHEIDNEITEFHGEEWEYHVRRLLPLPSDLDEKLRFLWRQNLPLTAEEFAQKVVPYISVERDGIVERPDWAELFRKSLNE
jgi:hypothetical protein